MALASNLGFPRIGAKRELKKAQESFWKGDISESDLQQKAKELRAKHWKLQSDAGIDLIPCNDFSLYDQVLDMAVLLGAVPKRYGFSGDNVDLATYFAMARGRQDGDKDLTAMEMTKWFDTNYHYIVPELKSSRSFKVSSAKIFDEFDEAKALGITTKPVLIGPITFLLLSKVKEEGVNALDHLPKLLPVYSEIIEKLSAQGAQWIQIDEPFLAMDIDDEVKKAYQTAYSVLEQKSDAKILLTTYFEGLRDNKDIALSLPVQAIHIDLVRSANQLDDVLADFPADKILSVGVVNGRNIWKTNLDKAISTVEKAVNVLGSDRVIISPSCSLLHSPVDLDSETKFDDELKSWLSFAKQKLQEIAIITKAVNGGRDSVAAELRVNADAVSSRSTSTRIHNQEVKQRVADLKPSDKDRHSPFAERKIAQANALGLPLLPTTTIGSFPQTTEVRQARAKFRKGDISREDYNIFLEEETKATIKKQEDLDIDVLVHGEFERNDMVEYFGEKLEGFAFSKFGWVQSYGSRCVKPPIIFGDVSRSEPMTVYWAQYAQGLTDKLVKGMLTGPVTILQWSFVRDDQPRKDTTDQIAFAIRDEVVDLEAAGIKVIQIDEPAIREGLPLRKEDWNNYLEWSVDAFRISASGVRDETQIHTHMCYSEFNDMMDAIARMDADVISMETSRSQMELLDAFVSFKYPNEIGPGVYDIHSPRVPNVEEMQQLLEKALKVLSADQLWVNPDCGLKTRGWKEVEPALKNMVEAAINLRKTLAEDNSRKSA